MSIGVDPGSNMGAIAVITEDLEILELRTAPSFTTRSTKQNKPKLNKQTGKYERDYQKRSWTDYRKLGEIYEPYLNGYKIIYTVEKVFVKSQESTISGFVFGASWGAHVGQCSLLKPLAFYEPIPTEWKNRFSLTGDKEGSVKLANDIFDRQIKKKFGKLLKFQVSNNNKHADMAESALIALYGILTYKEENS